MEILIGIAVVLVLVFCVTGDWGMVVLAVAGMTALAMLVFLGFFIFFLIRMLDSEKKTARFVRVGKSGKRKYESAVYEIDGKEYPDIFPAEPIFRKRIYRADTDVTVRFSEKHSEVYDKNTVIIITVGTVAFAASATGIACVLIGLI